MGCSRFSLILVLTALVGLACTDSYKDEDPNYSEVKECDVKYSANDPDTAVWTFIWEVKKEIPETCKISIDSFRKESNGYGAYIYKIPDAPANMFLENANVYQDIRATGNFPAKFPFAVGTYSINEYNFKQPSYVAMESNDYYFEVNITTLDGENDVTILGMRLFVSVK